MRRPRSRNGITLLEVLVALVVIGVTVAVARVIADQIVGAAQVARHSLDERLLARARDGELRRVFALASAPVDSLAVFDGAIDDVALTTRCVDTRGFEGTCRCRLSVASHMLTDAVLERRCDAGVQPDTLVADSVGLTLLYLVDVSGGGRWIREWRKTNSLPQAIGVVRHGALDTLIVRIGERG